MPTNPCTFRTRDLTQAILGATRARLKVRRIEVDYRAGRISVYTLESPAARRAAAQDRKTVPYKREAANDD